VAADDHTSSGAEQRAKTTAVAIVAAAQNGTYACARVLQAYLGVGGLGPRREPAIGVTLNGGLARAIVIILGHCSACRPRHGPPYGFRATNDTARILVWFWCIVGRCESR